MNIAPTAREQTGGGTNSPWRKPMGRAGSRRLVGGEVEEGEEAFAEGRNFGAFEVDLAIEGHEDLDGLELGIVA